MLGDRLKELREQAGLSQVAVAGELRVKPATISRYERGTNEPDAKTLVWYATRFNVSVDWILELSDERTKRDLTPAEREALQKAAADIKGYETTDEELAAKLPADIREGILALIRLERDKHSNN